MLPGRRTAAALRVPVTPAGGVIGTDRRFHVLCVLAYVLACVAWGLHAGKDLSFDQLNYHAYSAFSLLHDRHGLDFMAASVQGYMNPVGYLPYYALVHSGAPAWLVISALSVLHGLNLAVLHAVGWTALGAVARRRTYTVFGTCLGALSPVFLLEVGNSFNDIVVLLFQLASVLAFLVLVDEAPRRAATIRRAGMLLGACTGVAIGLKLTALWPATLLAVLLVVSAWRRPSGAARAAVWRALAWGALSACALFAAVEGHWAWRTWQETGNPLFPLFNGLFRSDYFPTDLGRHMRFVPQDFVDGLLRPVRMLSAHSGVYVETIAGDLRPLALVVLALPAMAAGAWRARPGDAPGRWLAVLVVALWASWLPVSGNGRYALLLLVLIGPVLAWCASRCAPAMRSAALLALGLLIGVQAVVQFVANDARWAGGRDDGPWFGGTVPARLATEPMLVLAASGLSGSFIVPFLSPDSAFVNVGGQFPFVIGDARYRRIEPLLHRFAGRTVALVHVLLWNEAHRPAAGTFVAAEEALQTIGLSLQTARCRPAGVREPSLVVELAGAAAIGDPDLAGQRFVLCPVREAPLPPPVPAAIVRAFDALKQRCPALFAPASTPITQGLQASADGAPYPRRSYVSLFQGSDTDLRSLDGELGVVGYRGGDRIALGRVDGFDPSTLDCRALDDRLRHPDPVGAIMPVTPVMPVTPAAPVMPRP